MSMRQLFKKHVHCESLRPGAARKVALVLAVAFAGTTLGGCQQYIARQDKIVYWAGESKAHNTAVHMVDPWPRHAFRTGMRTPGVKAEAAMKEYRSGDKSAAKPANFAPTLTAGGASTGGN
jgi:hypothetical protein